MIRHFIVERNREPRAWDPANPDPELPRDCPYFGKALVEMEKHLPADDIHCYLTWDNDSLPEYGSHVVTILVGEEWGMIPRYARHVRLAARVMGRDPFLGIRKWFPLSRLKLMLASKHVRNWLLHARSWWRYQFPPPAWPPRVHDKARIVHLPWGCASLVDVPMKGITERSRNYFFSGAVAFGADFGYRKFTNSPKMESRRSLVAAVAQLEKRYPSLSAGQAVSVHSDTWTGALTDAGEYAQRLMDSKVCLAPRGSVADTWRFFEGLKSGCAVITNPLPDEWYYRGAPVIMLDDWSELEKTIIPLLADEVGLEEIHLKALKYWEDVCGEKAVGKFLASALSDSD